MEQGGLYRAVADVRNEVTGATLKEIYAEIDKMREGGPEAEELSDAKQYSRGLFVIQNATQTGLANTLNTVNTFACRRTIRRHSSARSRSRRPKP
jgi:zinc protease